MKVEVAVLAGSLSLIVLTVSVRDVNSIELDRIEVRDFIFTSSVQRVMSGYKKGLQCKRAYSVKGLTV